MGLDQQTNIVLASVFGTLGFMGVVFIMYYFFRQYLKLSFQYNVVNHSLDEEEMQFKKIIEMQSDDIEELFDIPDEDVDFDVKERDRLSMLENYRRNLVANAQESDNVSDLRL
jgi:hypothetical protein